MNAAVKQTADVFRAAHALGFKPHHITPDGDGMYLQKPNKPRVRLSYEDARRWAEEARSADYD